MTPDKAEYIIASWRASPLLATVGAMLAGITLQNWVLIATLCYTVLQCALLIKKLLKKDTSKYFLPRRKRYERPEEDEEL